MLVNGGGCLIREYNLYNQVWGEIWGKDQYTKILEFSIWSRSHCSWCRQGCCFDESDNFLEKEKCWGEYSIGSRRWQDIQNHTSENRMYSYALRTSTWGYPPLPFFDHTKCRRFKNLTDRFKAIVPPSSILPFPPPRQQKYVSTSEPWPDRWDRSARLRPAL